MEYPLRHKVVRDLKIVTEEVGTLLVKGTAYLSPDSSVLDYSERYSVDVDFVEWNGTDIKPVLEVTGALEEVEGYCLRQAHRLFTREKEVSHV